MRAKDDIYLREMRKRVRKLYRLPDQRGPSKRSFGEDLARIIDNERKKKKAIPADIRYWLLLFEEVIGVWLIIWSLYRDKIEHKTGKQRMLYICLLALAGRVFQDMVCIREQIKLGFFVQSNVVTRSLIEAIDVMHLLSMRPDLAEKFRAVELNDQASKFWHSYCSRDRIHKLVKERWLWFFGGQDNYAESFHGQRSSFLDLMGMSAHPTFAASFVTFMDSPIEARRRNIFFNAIGTISHLSKFTMHLIFLRAFEYGILWVGPHAGIYRSRRQSRNQHAEPLSKGLSMLFSIVRAVDDKEEGDPFYPKFQTYWPAAQFKSD